MLRRLIARAGRRTAGAAALLLAFGLGFSLGQGEPAAVSPARGTALAGATPRAVYPRPGHSGLGLRPGHSGLGPRPGLEGGPQACAHHAPAQAGASPGELPAAEPPPPLDLEAKLQRMRALLAGEADEHACDDAYAAAEELQAAVEIDPQALAQALARLRSAQDPAELELLASVLGRVRDLEVEETALELTRSAQPAAQAAGYDMLDALDLPAAREASLEGLRRARDTDVRRAALRALPLPTGASLEEAGPVVASLRGVLSADPDSELRRRAAVELGRWHRGPEDLGPVLSALERDPDPNVRAGAAFGLELAARRDPALVEALVRVMRRPDEDPLVRENAWKALGALGPLTPEVQAEWRRFQDDQAATLGGS